MLTPAEKERRKHHLGSSDVAVLLGISPWKTAYDLWLDKTGKLNDAEFEENESMALGHALEGPLLRWAAREQGIKLIRNQFRVHSGGILSATHDGLARDNLPIGFEAKTAGVLRGFASREQWGEANTDQIPDYYMIQCQEQMLVSNLEMVWVPALLGGRGRVMYCVTPNKDLMDIILERATEFWERHVKADIPPDGWPTLDVARVIRRTEGKRVSIASDKVKEWRELDRQAKELQDKADAAKAAVLALMGDAEEGECELGVVKAAKGKRKGIDLDALRKSYPDVAKSVTVETDTVTVRFKANKGEAT
jgi:putative phage-type endonuclease